MALPGLDVPFPVWLKAWGCIKDMRKAGAPQEAEVDKPQGT